jgi:hypothetical protein
MFCQDPGDLNPWDCIVADLKRRLRRILREIFEKESRYCWPIRIRCWYRGHCQRVRTWLHSHTWLY